MADAGIDNASSREETRSNFVLIGHSLIYRSPSNLSAPGSRLPGSGFHSSRRRGQGPDRPPSVAPTEGKTGSVRQVADVDSLRRLRQPFSRPKLSSLPAGDSFVAAFFCWE